MSEIAGLREKDGGLGSIQGFKGAIYLDKAMKILNKGTGELKKLLDGHVLVFMDFGIVTHISAVFLTAELQEQADSKEGPKIKAKWVNKIFSGRAMYRESGIDDLMYNLDELKTDQERAMEADLSEHHSRTMDIDKFRAFIHTFNTHADALMKKSFTEEAEQRRFKKNQTKQSYMSQILNTVLAFVDAIGPEKKGAPILVVGNPTFGATRKKHRSAPPKKTLEYLSRFFMVLVVNEYNSSKLCPCCMKELTRVGYGYRIWKCNRCKRGDGQGDLIVNKDKSACLNFFRILVGLVVSGSRPAQFDSKNARGMKQAAFTKVSIYIFVFSPP